jgi:phospholipid transport system substrate-binding protein
MKIASWMFALMLSITPLQGRADIQPPDELIKSTVREVLEVINQEKRTTDAGQKRILEFIDAKVLPHFNFERMTKLAVGRPWRSATPEQRKELVTEFRTLLVRTYTKAFTLYKDISVETKSVTVQANADEVTVKTVINRPGAPPLPVNYEMERTDSGWKAFDVSVEGISLVATHRGSFAEKVQQSGIDGLIKSLAELNRASSSNSSTKAAVN